MKSQLPVPARQRGGTLLGFVIGALFGLALALGVAIYVSKVPISFNTKVSSRPAETPAESEKNKDWNPNAGLPGRVTPPKAEEELPPAAAPDPGPAPTASTPGNPTASPRSADPLGDLARARSEAPRSLEPPARPAAPEPAADPFQYFVQTGAYRLADEAEQQRARLSLMGLQARVSEREQAGRLIYRVRLGPFERREDADKALERLEAASVAAVVVRVQR